MTTRKQRQIQNAHWMRETAKTSRPGNKEEIIEAIKKTHLAYLWDKTPKPHTLNDNITSATVHLGTTQRRIEIPANTQGWVYIDREYTYDKYTRIDDWEVPANGSKIIKIKSYYTWCCLVKVNDHWVITESMATTERTY